MVQPIEPSNHAHERFNHRSGPNNYGWHDAAMRPLMGAVASALPSGCYVGRRAREESMPARSLHPIVRPTTARPANLTYQLRPPAGAMPRHSATTVTRGRPAGCVFVAYSRTAPPYRMRCPLVINGGSLSTLACVPERRCNVAPQPTTRAPVSGGTTVMDAMWPVRAGTCARSSLHKDI